MPLFLTFTSSLWFSFRSFFLFSLVFSCILLFYSFFFFFFFLLPPSPLFTVHGCPLFIPSAIMGFTIFVSQSFFGFLWVSFQDCPLACQLPSHYLSSKFIGCTTLHSQTKSFVLFLTSFCSCLTQVDKN